MLYTNSPNDYLAWPSDTAGELGVLRPRSRDPTINYRREIAHTTRWFGSHVNRGDDRRNDRESSNGLSIYEGSHPFGRASHESGSVVMNDLARPSSSARTSRVNAFLEAGWDKRVTMGQRAGVGRRSLWAQLSPTSGCVLSSLLRIPRGSLRVCRFVYSTGGC